MFFDILKVGSYIFIFVLILWLLVFVMRKMSVYATSFGTSKYMKVVDRLAINKDAGVLIVQIGEKYMLLGVSSGNVEILRELSEEELKEFQSESYVNTQVYEKLTKEAAKAFKNIYCKISSVKKGQLKERRFADMLNIKFEGKTRTGKDSAIDEILDDSVKRTRHLKNKIAMNEGDGEHEKKD
ncbi:MAG: flagellar biosynthetic protein FliO [Clostridia bacterium]|nr:flagellar biosynthetic protein FliO [Clostridia bacterium]